ncbi:hypothetical protein BRETT_001260 [Brettanomyces bruxellensis]|uniref:Autophagy-related protein 18 n=1 Tax=Dekkera bruxellensis TaxID=5007 RepID=A0A871R8F1_DEKBR|nr:uncharacterized protein BRETT_001260 [Brettanomyces bruxellensis]QOU21536.1 hypothetical protein BRETT_001260 [Brettanomyces bruxellensis]
MGSGDASSLGNESVTIGENQEEATGTHPELNFANFNQDYSCLSVGYSDGYKVFNCEPFGQCYTRKDGGVGIIEMLFTSSLLVLVGSGEQSALSPRRLKVVNTKRQTTICELTFPDTILAVKLNRDRLVVLLEKTVYIYDVHNMRLLHTVEIPANPLGLIALAASSEHNYLAYPSPPRVSVADLSSGGQFAGGDNISGNAGAVNGGAANSVGADTGKVDALQSNGSDRVAGGSKGKASVSQLRTGDVVIFDCSLLQPISVIEAHKTRLSALALSIDGTLLATASDKGTIVRVFSVETGNKLYQFRRGTYPTKIYSLAFSVDNKFVVASSATETVHIFRLGDQELANTQRQSRSARPGDGSKANSRDDNSNSSEDVESTGRNSSLVDEDVLADEDMATNSSEVTGPDSEYDLLENASTTSTGSDMQPVVDSTRRTVARMLRRTSQTLGRKAAERMGGYLPPRFSSILEPNRHFASLKVPASKDTTTIVGIGRTEVLDGSIDSGVEKSKLIHIMVVTSEGLFYTFGLDPDRGGDCVLLSQRSLLD